MSRVSGDFSYQHNYQVAQGDKAVKQGTSFFRKIAQMIWDPGSDLLKAADSHIQAKGIRQHTSIRDYTDYSKLDKQKVLNLFGSISSEKELLHFCLVYNPSRLLDAKIINENQCNFLKSKFDLICKHEPQLLNAMTQHIKNGASLNSMKVDEIFQDIAGAPLSHDKNSLNQTIKNECHSMANNTNIKVSEEWYSTVTAARTTKTKTKGSSAKTSKQSAPKKQEPLTDEERRTFFTTSNMVTLGALVKGPWTGQRTATKDDWRGVLRQGFTNTASLKAKYDFNDQSKANLQIILSEEANAHENYHKQKLVDAFGSADYLGAVREHNDFIEVRRQMTSLWR